MKALVLLLSSGLLFSFNCSRNTMERSTQQPIVQKCFSDRNVVESVSQMPARVLWWNDMYLLSSDDGTSKWQPCELPGDFRKDGLKVWFDGDVMNLMPGERRAATPLHLKNIVRRD